MITEMFDQNNIIINKNGKRNIRNEFRLLFFIYKDRSTNNYALRITNYALIMSFMTSPAIISPATDGTNAQLPGV